VAIKAGNPLLKTPKHIFFKEFPTLILTKDAKAVLKEKGDNIMAIEKHGKEETKTRI